MSEVGVVGAGPVGLTLACALTAQGRPCTVYEQQRNKPQVSKAFAVHARTLELLRQIGVDQQVIGEGRAIRRMNLYAEKNRLGVVDFRHLSSEFPFFISIPQYRLEAILRERLAQLGGHVNEGCSFVSLEQTDADGPDGQVRVKMDRDDGQMHEAAHRYLVGADGAHSSVRKHLGLKFSGDTYDSEFLVVDAQIEWPGNVYEAHTYMSRRGYLMLMPFPGRGHRIVTDIPFGHFKTPPSMGEVQSLLQSRGFPELQLSHTSWINTTRYHRRLVDRFRQGRVFLAGDACHIHSPVGGQGLNTGMQDAFNLAWRMAMVLDKRAGGALLDRYDAERRRVAETVLRNTDLMTRRFATRNPVKVAARNLLMPLAFASSKVQRKLVADAAGLAIGYADLEAAARNKGALSVGARLPDLPVRDGTQASRLHRHLSQTHYSLIYVDRAGRFKQAAALTGLCRRFEHLVQPLFITTTNAPGVADTLALVTDAVGHRQLAALGDVLLILVRPDGYISHLGTDQMEGWQEVLVRQQH